MKKVVETTFLGISYEKKMLKIKIMCNLCYFRTNDMMQWIKISLSFVFMFHFQRLNHRQVVMRCICRFTRRGSSSLFCVGRLNIFLQIDVCIYQYLNIIFIFYFPGSILCLISSLSGIIKKSLCRSLPNFLYVHIQAGQTCFTYYLSDRYFAYLFNLCSGVNPLE